MLTSQGVLPTSAKGLLTTRTIWSILSLLNVFCKDLKSLSEKRKARGPAMGFSRGDQWGCLENELKMQFRHTPPPSTSDTLKQEVEMKMGEMT